MGLVKLRVILESVLMSSKHTRADAFTAWINSAGYEIWMYSSPIRDVDENLAWG